MTSIATKALNKVTRILDVPGEEADKWLEMLGDFFYSPDTQNQLEGDCITWLLALALWLYHPKT